MRLAPPTSHLAPRASHLPPPTSRTSHPPPIHACTHPTPRISHLPAAPIPAPHLDLASTPAWRRVADGCVPHAQSLGGCFHARAMSPGWLTCFNDTVTTWAAGWIELVPRTVVSLASTAARRPREPHCGRVRRCGYLRVLPALKQDFRHVRSACYLCPDLALTSNALKPSLHSLPLLEALTPPRSLSFSLFTCAHQPSHSLLGVRHRRPASSLIHTR